MTVLACHNGNYNNTPNTCFGCHQDNYNNTTNPDHEDRWLSEWNVLFAILRMPGVLHRLIINTVYPLTGGHSEIAQGMRCVP